MMPLVGPDGGAFGHVDAVTFQGLVTVPGMAGFERSLIICTKVGRPRNSQDSTSECEE